MLIRPKSKRNLTGIGSTSATLSNGGSYESDIFNVSTSEKILGTCQADQDGILYINQSMDGVNFDYENQYNYVMGEKLGFSIECVCKYARIKFINGGTQQGIFRLSWGVE